MKREQLLETAKQTVCHDRNDQYGEPEDVFNEIAGHWTNYVAHHCLTDNGFVEISEKDVAAMMIMLKVSRITNHIKADNWIDIAGYAACGSEVEGE